MNVIILLLLWVKVQDLENLASVTGVKQVQSVVPPVINTGSVTTEGDAIHKTSDVRSIYSQSGAGMKSGHYFRRSRSSFDRAIYW